MLGIHMNTKSHIFEIAGPLVLKTLAGAAILTLFAPLLAAFALPFVG